MTMSERKAGKVLKDNPDYSPEHKSDFLAVGDWMIGHNVERPTKRQFDRVYSDLIDEGNDGLAAFVERAAKRAGREDADEAVQTATPARDEEFERGAWRSHGEGDYEHAHAHKRGHHIGRCGLFGCSQRPHAHHFGGRAHRQRGTRRR